MHLEDFPRPAKDNGIGIHFGFDLRPTSLESFTAHMAELRVKWCLLPHGDEHQLERAAGVMAPAGIFPISQWLCQIDQNILEFTRYVRVLEKLQLPAYIQIFNEPSELREWRDSVPKPRAFTSRWCDHAARVADAGGFPGLQVLDVEELRAVLKELKARDGTNVIERMWFCPHAYGANHPPDYPYDRRNQYDHPGATVTTDDVTVLHFLQFAAVFKDELGFVPPFIAGEGGWQFGNAEDGRYPKIGDAQHAEYHAALFNWFRTGFLSNGDPLPDYLFAVCPWILFGPEADAWFSYTTGTRQQTLDAIRAIPPFVHQIGPRPPTPPPSPTLSHYALFGPASPEQEARLHLAQAYLTRFNIASGSSLTEALWAKQVSIIGDYGSVSLEDEAQLKRAGCRVERLLGDDNALQIILNDRLRRDQEF